MIGLEKELFLFNAKGKLVLNPGKYGFETDNLGVLVEIRGEPKNTVEEAVASLLSKELLAKGKAAKHNYQLKEVPSVKLSDEEILEVTKRYHKEYEEKFSPKSKECRVAKKLELAVINAGLHVHFSREINIPQNKTIIKLLVMNNDKDSRIEKEISHESESYTVQTFIDIPKIISTLDNSFKEEIKKTNRRLSAYEIKGHGFEYRSLPNNIDLSKVSAICSDLSPLFSI